MIQPGATIGILGGGQLGRMTGLAARSLGYDVHVLDPDPHCPASVIASRTVAARFDDADAAASLAERCAVVTLEIEQIGAAALAAVAARTPLRPSAEAVQVIQDRIRQKTWLSSNGFPVGAFRAAASRDESVAAFEHLGRCIFKSTSGGYDGRGQIRVGSAEAAADAWKSLGERPCLVERFLDIASEISMLVARRPVGARSSDAMRHVTFPPSFNHHEHGILDWSVLPASVAPHQVRQAEAVANGIAEALGIEGLIAVEMFIQRDGTLLVNELAPRPHNTFHSTERGCATSQFEQLVRAVCDLPLGSTEMLRPAAIANLLGDLWSAGTPDFAAALTVPSVRLHLYGKASARPGRKMGHLSAVGVTGEEARDRVLRAREAMRIGA
ncbi:MAG TPA: 5-(carboxyamino)imidazole ribonucleotide synthase [Gemmatimonadaceae bacterium]|nr:5-(carboxyamino)imidazole ribonucleotide synthase [Gemmatimonadaceae bacterium]